MEDASPLPYIEVGKMIGMLVYLEDLDGKTDIYIISSDLGLEMDELVSLIKISELLDFVKVKEGDLYITQTGKDLVYGDENKRKIIFKKALKKLPVFQKIINILLQSEDKTLQKSKLLSILLEEMSEEEANETLKSLIELGRYAELIGYNPEDKDIYLDMLEE
jgi:NitT/TauT family transport system ATP-binding protein